MVRPASTARTMQDAPAMSSSVSSASGLSKRNISAAAGVTASAAPASSPATGPDQRRTAPYSRPTAPTPHSACGTSRLQDDIPKIRADRPDSHSAAGGLSTVITLPGSSAPKNQAFQLIEPAWVAAA